MAILSTFALFVALLSFLDPIDAHKTILERPKLHWGPKTPGHQFPHSPKRHKTCYVPNCLSSGHHGKNDDTPEILKAFKNCNKGGTVILNEEYTIASPLDLTFLEAVDVAITGTIKFTNDIDYWVKNSFNGLISSLIALIYWSVISTSQSRVRVKNPAKNGDGWDTFRSDSVVIQDSHVNNSDDCVSFKPNSTNIIVQGMQCNGSHGISVGSLGQYPAEYDIVENIYVYNVSMSNASDGARIKVWPGTNTPFEPGLSGGGGAGYVKNVTYDTFYNSNNDWAIEINQCYGQSNQTICDKYPSNITISDVIFKNMWGTTSTKYDPKVGTLTCSSTEKCLNISAYNISVIDPSGKTPQWICTNMDESLLDINCVSANS
ncbi:hypothetical protein TrVGV298_004722 [Trichoderma virens]|nr:hypothetical protein TrVGV298_004722 [Trichoderma virens]